MVYESKLSEADMKLLRFAMEFPLYDEADIIVSPGGQLVEIQEKACAHGAPLVKILNTGETKRMTLYGHSEVFDKLKAVQQELRDQIRQPKDKENFY